MKILTNNNIIIAIIEEEDKITQLTEYTLTVSPIKGDSFTIDNYYLASEISEEQARDLSISTDVYIHAGFPYEGYWKGRLIKRIKSTLKPAGLQLREGERPYISRDGVKLFNHLEEEQAIWDATIPLSNILMLKP